MVAVLSLQCISIAQEAKPAPLPAIVLKYVNAVKSMPALSVKASQLGGDDNATVQIVRPGHIVITTLQGQNVVSTLVSNGKTVTEWDKTQYASQPAPKTLADINPSLPMGAAASIASGLLTDTTSITDYANLHDTGIVTLRGMRAHRVVSIEDGDTATFWLDDRTGLPVQAAYTGGRHNRVVILSPYVFGRAAQRLHVPLRPLKLVRFVPSPTPKLLAAGTPAPDFTLPRASGTGDVTLSALKRHVVLVDFWASWCRPCKKTMPHIQALNAALGPKGLVVLSVNTWDMQARMSKFVLAHPQYTSTFLFDGSPSDQSIASAKYHVWGIPTVYIIDKDGAIAGAFIGDDPKAAAQIKATLAKLGLF